MNIRNDQRHINFFAGITKHLQNFGAYIIKVGLLGIENKKGSLIPGKDADIIIFDDDIRIQTTIVNGKVIYTKQ